MGGCVHTCACICKLHVYGIHSLLMGSLCEPALLAWLPLLKAPMHGGGLLVLKLLSGHLLCWYFSPLLSPSPNDHPLEVGSEVSTAICIWTCH